MRYSLYETNDSRPEIEPNLNEIEVGKDASSAAPSNPDQITIQVDNRTGRARVVRTKRPFIGIVPGLNMNRNKAGTENDKDSSASSATNYYGNNSSSSSIINKSRTTANYKTTTPNEGWFWLLLFLLAMAAGFLLLPPALLVLLPAILLLRQAYCFRPRPPGSLKFTLAALALALVPGGYAFSGFLAVWFELLGQFWSGFGNSKTITRQQLSALYRLVTGPLQPLALTAEPLQSMAGMLVFTALPTYSLLLLYFLWYRKAAEKALVELCLSNLKAEEDELEAARQEAQVHIQAKVDQEKTALAAHEVILLGEEVDRHWLFPAMQWELIPRAVEERQYRWLNLNNLIYHLISCGATRSGKSVNLARPVIQYAIANRIGAVIIDPKGDLLTPADTSLNFTVSANEAGSSSCRLCLIDDRVSLTTAARNFAEAVIDMDEVSPDSRFFITWARRALSAILIGYRVVYNQWPELLQVLVYASNPEALRKLSTNLKEIQFNPACELELRHRAEEQLLEFGSLVNLMPGKSKTNPFETVANSIQAIATEKYRHAVTTNTRYGRTIRQILEESLTARFSYNISEGEVSRQLNRVIVRQFTTFAMEPLQGQTQARPKLLVVDEASEVICEALGTLVTKGAGREAGAILLFQNLSQVRDSRLAHDIFANCRTKLVLAGTSSDTAGIFSELSGTCVVPMLTNSAGVSAVQSQGLSRNQGVARGRGSSSNTIGAGTSANHSLQEGYSENSNRSQGRNRAQSKVFKERPSWNPSEIMSLPRFHALAWLYDGTGDIEMQLLKFVTPDVRKELVPAVQPPKVVLDQNFVSGVPLLQLQTASSSGEAKAGEVGNKGEREQASKVRNKPEQKPKPLQNGPPHNQARQRQTEADNGLLKVIECGHINNIAKTDHNNVEDDNQNKPDR